MQGGVQGAQPPDGEIGMQKLLKHLDRGGQRPPLLDVMGQRVARGGAQRMRPAHRVHKDVGVDEDHVVGRP